MTLVIFRLPDKTLVCKNVYSFPIPPIGHTYVFTKKSYVVEGTAEPLSQQGGFSQILDLLRLEYDDANTAATAIAGMIPLDAPKLEVATTITIATEPDNVLLVRLGKPGNKPAAKPKTVSMFDLDVKSLVSGDASRLRLAVPSLDIKSLVARAQQGLDGLLKASTSRSRSRKRDGSSGK